MCVVSMVYDHYKDKFPWQYPTINTPHIEITTSPPIPSAEVIQFRELIKEFREAVAAAKVVDTLTGQPDCEDPEKMKLEDRVALLEKRIKQLESGSA